MNSQNRYEIQGEIASGDFATVYRGRDLELGRDVAIKQIHQQFLSDPAQLERYWQEAQLLASLHHPYIVTIYDIVRERGWLILELMQGSVQQQLAGQPCPLDFLRVLMVCSLHALRVLEENGIVHGDVKPGNLLLDSANRVKLGDFGIARRATGDDGSLLKGTTKYMAPEVVSDQFGPVGPYSDLYSLGFTAYELMCGEHFDSLFPGLDMFGRDRQVAWMMWHAALDRRLPEIPRVLEGVPDDLAHVITRLTEKDPNRRYRSASEALHDLREKADLPNKGPSPQQVEEAETADREQKKKRLLAVAALSVSVVVSGLALFLPTGGTEKPPVVQSAAPTEGIVRAIDPRRSSFNIEPASGGEVVQVKFDPKAGDELLIDGTLRNLADLREGDRVKITYYELKSDNSKTDTIVKKVNVLRETAQSDGQITQVLAESRVLEVTPQQGERLRVYVPTTLPLEINGAPKFNGRPVQFSDLTAGDRVALHHKPREGGLREATLLRAARVVPLDGYVVSYATEPQRTLTLRLGQAADAPLRTYPVAEECEITLDGQATSDGRQVQLANLREGDFVSTTHDTEFQTIDASREHSDSGIVADVDVAGRTLLVRVRDQAQPTRFKLADDAELQSMETGAAVELAAVRPGDTVNLTHDSVSLDSPVASHVAVRPVKDKSTWAIVVGQADYDDQRVDSLPSAAHDAQQVRQALVTSHRVPESQVLFSLDSTRRKLEQEIPGLLAQVPADARLIVYFVVRGFLPPDGDPVLATQEFDLGRMEQSGLSLRWLLDQLEACPAHEKLLILDTCHAAPGESAQPSSAELARALKRSANRPVSKTVTVVASCAAGQTPPRGADDAASPFALATSAALAGAADSNNNHQVEADEYYAFVQSALAKSAQQTPVRFIPDPTPARLPDAAQEAIRGLLTEMAATTLDTTAFNRQFEAAESLAPDQPDSKIAAGLVLLKQGKTSYSARLFKAALVDHPDALLARHGMAWQEFARGRTEQGLEELTALIGQIPLASAGKTYPPYARHLVHWAGEIRAFVSTALPEGRRPDKSLQLALDNAIKSHGEVAKADYTRGFQQVREKVNQIDAQLGGASSDSQRTQLEFDRRRLTYYTGFDFDAAEAFLLSGLDR